MSPIPRHEFVPRNSSSDTRYGIIFAAVGSVLVIIGVLWGYFLPKWQKKHRRPVETKYTCIGRTTVHQSHSDHDLELPLIFPPHPAVVVPLIKKRKSTDQSCVHDTSLTPVHDLRTQSPFPVLPRTVSRQFLISEARMKGKIALPVGRPIYLHTARLQRSQSQNPFHGHTLLETRGTPKTHEKAGYTQGDSMDHGRSSFLVARSAGAPPIKLKSARLAPQRLRHDSLSRKIPATFSASCLSTVSASGYRKLPGRRHSDQDDSNSHFIAANVGGGMVEKEELVDTQKPITTPGQAGFGFRNLFKTPSSPGTATTTRFGSSANCAHYYSTPPTAPTSSAVPRRGGTDTYPRISNLVPSRRFQAYIATTRSSPIARTDDVAEAYPRLSSEDTHEPTDFFRVGYRPVSGNFISPCRNEQC